MMVEFTKTTLGDCISTIIDYRGKTPKKLGGDWANEGYRAFSAKNIKTGQIVNPESIRYIDENLYKSWMKDEIKRGDIIITSGLEDNIPHGLVVGTVETIDEADEAIFKTATINLPVNFDKIFIVSVLIGQQYDN